MKETIKNAKQNITLSKQYILNVLKWGICSIIIGCVCGLIGTLFHYLVEKATELRIDQPSFIYLAPLIGLIIIFMYSKLHMLDNGGTNAVIESIHSAEKVPLKMTPLIFISTILTHLCGGSSGREGAALQIGGSLGSSLGYILKMNDSGMRILTMCGMSSVFSALFGTPITATIFSMEVISVGVLYYSAFIPCILSATIAYGISQLFDVTPVSFVLKKIPNVNILSISRVVLLATLCALVSILFCVTMHKISKLYKVYIKNEYIRAFVGGLLIIALTLLFQSHDYNGAGMNIVERAISGSAKPQAFVIKILFTAITLGAGFKGGEIVPSFFIGATFGNVIGDLIGLPPSFAAALGLIAVFCGVVNCPITSLILSIELFGSQGLILFGITSAVSYTLSGYYGLYSSQKIIYSKLNPTLININTNSKTQ